MPDFGSIRLPAGMRDYLPLAASRRLSISRRLVETFESHGYERIITPLFECADVLERGLGAEGRASAIRFVEPQDGEVVALRPDITPQVARLVATRLQRKRPMRLCYRGPVTRLAERATAFHRQEVTQVGCELVNLGPPRGDAEAISVATEALGQANLRDVRIELGHIAFTRIALAQLPDDVRQDIRQPLAAKDRAGVRRVCQHAKLTPALRQYFEALPTLYGEPRKVLARFQKLSAPPAVKKGADELQDVLAMLKMRLSSSAYDQISIDLGEVRGFDYYTGMRFAGYAAGAGGALLKGGRYDHLLGRYGFDARATGFAIDVERLAEAQEHSGHRGYFQPRVLVLAPTASESFALKFCASIRSCGFPVALDVETKWTTRSQARIEPKVVEAGFSHLVIFELDTGIRLVGGLRPQDTRFERKLSKTMVRQAIAGESQALAKALLP